MSRRTGGRKSAGTFASLEGKVILVTGGSRGIGRAIVRAVSDAGALPIIHYNRDERSARSLAREIGMKTDGSLVKADISSPDGIERLVEYVRNAAGKLDALVNNAGIYSGNGIDEENFSEWDRVVDTNLRSHFFITKMLYPLLKERRGSVVNISSIMGIAPSAGAYPYQASKAALIHLTRALALELAPDVRVNCVAPGFIMTDINREGWENASFRREVEQDTPLGRWGVPEDIAGAVRFLLSDSASFITGQTLLIDGGKGLH
ncbi:MAG: SDR family oxidoreductase [Thermoplasmata archaeon]|uniref:SDR family oxidoreductase n=1 Tax=Candidatus Sysuiplasma superficiale TaxID=2823368 RepID=A0A8J7YTX3_9ARCH|nr:SDR family oxidoreductase [Candidatus Sysuiplasma superficiale]MBX8644042.1 SDR family oxidoreductase [Candidatus Sysuiplasma superficiale]